MTTATYATPLELAKFCKINGQMPDYRSVGVSRIKELVGTGDNSTTVFYLDHACLLTGTITLYAGTTEVAATALTATTHYTIDIDSGTITLTSAGVTAVGTKNIYAAYQYVKIAITEDELQQALNRAQEKIDFETYSHWATGTDATPDYIQVTNEKHTGKGKNDRDYYTDFYPIPDVSTTVLVDIASSAETTIYLASTNKLPASGYVLIDTDKVAYTAKGSTTSLTGVTGLTAGHSAATGVYPYVVEISTTDSGSTPDWVVLSIDDEFDLDCATGKVHIYKTDFDLTYYALQSPPRFVPNRFRVSYQYGYSSIYDDIKQLCLMIAAKELSHMAVRASHIDGRNDFKPELVDVDEQWIKETIKKHINHRSDNI